MRVLPTLVLTLSVTVLAASSAQAAGFGCSASAGRLTVLGQKVEPVTANADGSTCTADSKSAAGKAAGLPAPLSAGTLVSATEFYPAQKSVLASGGIADFAIGTSSLPIQLPQIPSAITDAIQGALKTVDLTAVKNAIPVLPVNLPTNLKTDYIENYTAASVGILDLLSGTLVTLANYTNLNAANHAQNVLNAATNAANQATNTANAALNQIRSSIPDSVAIDPTAVRSLLSVPSLPSLDLVSVRGAMAYAAGSCQSGSPSVTGKSQIAGVKVLGTDISLDQVLNTVKTLIPATPIDPTNLTVSASNLGLTSAQTDLISKTGAAQTALSGVVSTVNSTLQSALAGIPSLQIPGVLANVKVTPNEQVKDGDSITQRALHIVVTVAGQTIVDAVVGEAKASAAGVDCSAPVADPNTSEGATLQCSKRKLVLVDVLERAGRVKLYGVADPALAGKTVSIVFGATGQTVAHAKVAKDGSFDSLAPLPPAGLRSSNAARYTAVYRGDKSLNLKLRRRMIIDSMTSHGRRVTITGRVVKPLAQPLQAITLMRRVSCNEDRVVTRFRPRPDGTFRVSVLAPRGVGTVTYRMTTKVRNSSTGRALFETFTLPRAVDVG